MLKVTENSAAQEETHTFIIHVQVTPLVLNRVVTLVRRKNINIKTMTMSTTADSNVAQITLTLAANAIAAQRIKLNLEKLVEVLAIEDVRAERVIARELALVRLKASPEARSMVGTLAERSIGRVLDMNAATIVMELVGTPAQIEEALGALRPLGILETARTSPLGLLGGAAPASATAEPAEGGITTVCEAAA